MKPTCAVVAVLLALATSPLHAQAPYHNPVLQSPVGVADPFLLKWNGEYYLYATGDPITAYHSTDLVHWDTIGAVIGSSRAPEAWNQADVWAPEVVYRNGKFYLYYTASKASPDWRVGEMARRIGVGVSDSPRGPFVDSG
ncbi:MAG TPA: family 43 glycosylhydrolase, partial [Longimicrobiales bacterium]